MLWWSIVRVAGPGGRGESPSCVMVLQVVELEVQSGGTVGDTWAIGKIYGGTQALSAYYLFFVKSKKNKVDKEWLWAVEEGKAQILFMENKKQLRDGSTGVHWSIRPKAHIFFYLLLTDEQRGLFEKK